MDDNTRTSTHCTIEQHTNGIHEFCFLKPGRQSIDVALDALDDLLTNTPLDGQLFILWDLRGGIPPISYTFQRIKAMLRNHPERAIVRIAFVHSGGSLARMAQTFLDLLTTQSKRRMFNGDQYEEAVAWLLEA